MHSHDRNLRILVEYQDHQLNNFFVNLSIKRFGKNLVFLAHGRGAIVPEARRRKYNHDICV